MQEELTLEEGESLGEALKKARWDRTVSVLGALLSTFAFFTAVLHGFAILPTAIVGIIMLLNFYMTYSNQSKIDHLHDQIRLQKEAEIFS